MNGQPDLDYGRSQARGHAGRHEDAAMTGTMIAGRSRVIALDVAEMHAGARRKTYYVYRDTAGYYNISSSKPLLSDCWAVDPDGSRRELTGALALAR
jgi:hypothetical protein